MDREWAGDDAQKRKEDVCSNRKKVTVLKGLGVEKEPRTEHGADKGYRRSKLKNL